MTVKVNRLTFRFHVGLLRGVDSCRCLLEEVLIIQNKQIRALFKDQKTSSETPVQELRTSEYFLCHWCGGPASAHEDKGPASEVGRKLGRDHAAKRLGDAKNPRISKGDSLKNLNDNMTTFKMIGSPTHYLTCCDWTISRSPSAHGLRRTPSDWDFAAKLARLWRLK